MVYRLNKRLILNINRDFIRETIFDYVYCRVEMFDD